MFRSSLMAKYLALCAVLVVAACATPPPAPPPPPPVAVYIPPPARPVPPLNAQVAFPLPPKDIYGVRITPNSNIGDQQRIWHFRSAFNVAALSCPDPVHYRIAEDYNLFLTVHKKALDSANKAVEAMFKSENGKDYARVRDTFSTQVYNFFSLPPVNDQLCDVFLVLGQEAAVTPSADLLTFTNRALPQVEGVYEAFFAAYEKYETDLALWTALYAPNEQQASSFTNTNYVPSQPVYGPPTSEWTAQGDWSTPTTAPMTPEG